jgi:hypothetical protein
MNCSVAFLGQQFYQYALQLGVVAYDLPLRQAVKPRRSQLEQATGVTADERMHSGAFGHRLNPVHDVHGNVPVTVWNPTSRSGSYSMVSKLKMMARPRNRECWV